MKRISSGLFAMCVLLLSTATVCASAQSAALSPDSQPFPLSSLVHSAALSGVVRDTQGSPQMGTLVELLRADATPVAAALTDDHGRYLIASVLPGHYQLRATAAFFVPTRRSGLRLQAGTQAVVNLTMSTLFELGSWLPAERRPSTEPADDWKWTLRCTANRPLLRLADTATGERFSTSASEIHHPATQGRLTVTNGDGAFGNGGMHQVLTMDRVEEDGDGMILRADLGDPQSPLTVAPSADVLAGYERNLPFSGRTRMVAGYASHPELVANGVPGFEVLRMASTEEIGLGDAVLIDAGTLLEAERLEATRILTEPYLRVVVRAGDGYAVEYRFATGRTLQSADDLDRLHPQTMVLTDLNGHPLSEKGSHQEIALTRKLGDDSVSVSAYRDTFDNAAIAGSGAVDSATIQAAPLVSDPTTLTFRLAAAGYTADGAAVSYTHTWTPSLFATANYEVGSALRADQPDSPIGELRTHAHTASAASVSLHGRILRTGTAINAEYRWQPSSTLTQVDAYNVSPEEAFVSVALRQHIWGGRMLGRANIDAVVEATNLLEQGYTPVLAPDGHTLFLAQVPRAIQAGLAFNF